MQVKTSVITGRNRSLNHHCTFPMTRSRLKIEAGPTFLRTSNLTVVWYHASLVTVHRIVKPVSVRRTKIGSVIGGNKTG